MNKSCALNLLFAITAYFSFRFVSSEIPPVIIGEFTPTWIHSNDSEIAVPESPVLDDTSTDTVIDYSNANSSDTVFKQEVGVDGKSEDLSVGYTPGYCRCINRYYCSGPTQQRLRAQRAINTPPCRGRDEVMCCLTNGPGCGVPANFPYFKPYPLYGEANFGDYPWSALVMDTNNKAIYGMGITIAWKLVITTARNVAAYAGKRGTTFKVRLGEWDLSTNDEPFSPQEYTVSEVVIHPKYDPRTFQNDIALLRLSTSVDLSSFPNIRSACLAVPNENEKFIGSKCLVAGWGSEASKKTKQSVTARNLLKEVDMQILEDHVCQDALRRSIGNSQFLLDAQSFICAGSEPGKGLCKGDEGAALVCQDRRDSRFTVIGMSSWGTTCGQGGFPNVFTNMANYYDWIKSVDPNIGQ